MGEAHGGEGGGSTEDWELVALGLRDEPLEENGTIWPLSHPCDQEHRDVCLLWVVSFSLRAACGEGSNGLGQPCSSRAFGGVAESRVALRAEMAGGQERPLQSGDLASMQESRRHRTS